jgi:hypothetical protein
MEEIGERILSTMYNLRMPFAIGVNGTGSNACAGRVRPTSSAGSASIRLGASAVFSLGAFLQRYAAAAHLKGYGRN